MSAIKNILLAVASLFFVPSCGVGGAGAETGQQDLAASIGEMCEVSSPEDCGAGYALLFGEASGATSETPCGKCVAKCKKDCPDRKIPGCDTSCRAQCKGECGETGYDSAASASTMATAESHEGMGYGDNCQSKCERFCERGCKNDNPGCEQSCKSHCKQFCDHEDRD